MAYATENIVNEIYSHGFSVVDNFLGHQDYSQLLIQAQERFARGDFRPAKIGNIQHAMRHTTIRSDELCWLDFEPSNLPLQAYLKTITAICNHLNESLFLNLSEFEAHFAVYQPGTSYKKHVDQFKNTKNRLVSCVYYLNPDWQPAHGGELTLYDRNEQILAIIPPLHNRFVCFQSDLPHEVNTTQQMRYSITGWLKTRPQDLF
ncbi:MULTISPECIES: 2OG-Fe(II) oxygenase [Legionella]|uniref:2OG-Fe(II) oxygenase n=1 Tax=Legionella septentrionalis TaxID=2498109 RepID=A0A3S0WRF9_9GAMM|nr:MULTISPECIES: 2OG-Fe(II) oxygenase [Legionella]MCP0913874.1 2OG-Fe(II) oxygenase [Legionella sp. 27cVA30]RUQ85258.1 2OG-Fe(II) oxygenase [Legionella septentrionalis]RUQ98717.1 2OG-Fe(II) oxygenase [Legionella septentrionalis]RUR09910.1 2OG-Fe(II) oxygenase [Legionella septentrionalis]RUR15010.1 2OG-Fe(II) oxygenase [Legionella septentrionalis]